MTSTTLRVVIVCLCVPQLLLAQTGTAQVGGGAQATAGAGQPTALPPISPELNKILVDWSFASAKIDKLWGNHHRFVYDQVFGVEKRAEGKFYYESPSKGRIDLESAKIPNGAVSQKKDPKTGKPYQLKGERPEIWICNGKEIWQVQPQIKQIEIMPIPKEHQGRNIMDGPLPFLFGMPPEKARRRFNMKLLQQNQNHAWIAVTPRLKVDAANWQRATVILDKKKYLPAGVQLIDPSGNLETTYTFKEFKVNHECVPNLIKRILKPGDTNPFRPTFAGYARKVHQPGQQVRVAENNAQPRRNPVQQQPNKLPANPKARPLAVPSVAGLPWPQAKAKLEDFGFQVKMQIGKAAEQPQLIHAVYDQKPAARQPATEGQVVTFTIHNHIPGVVPNVTGWKWKDAEVSLKMMGYKYSFHKGAKIPARANLVQAQLPKAGSSLAAGGEVKLQVYTK